MNDEQTKDDRSDELPYGCTRWRLCVMDEGHDGKCVDTHGNERTASSLMRERWGK